MTTPMIIHSSMGFLSLELERQRVLVASISMNISIYLPYRVYKFLKIISPYILLTVNQDTLLYTQLLYTLVLSYKRLFRGFELQFKAPKKPLYMK